MDLAEFLAARLDEDERAANGVHARYCEALVGEYELALCDCRWPARVLREVEAKRRHLDQYRMALDACQRAAVDEANSLAGYRDATWGACLADAAVYSDHPDYDPAWAL